jgi:hypothetical protein
MRASLIKTLCQEKCRQRLVLGPTELGSLPQSLFAT